jgi:transposase
MLPVSLVPSATDVKQVPATYAKPFRQWPKNDFRDTHAVAEAVQRPTTRFVPAKTNDQLDFKRHRVRSRLVSKRTAVINQIRSPRMVPHLRGRHTGLEFDNYRGSKGQ